MKLEDILADPEGTWIAMERYVNDGSPSGVATTTSAATSPASDSATFELPFYACPGLATHTAVPVPPSPALPAGFPVHPDLDPVTEGGLGELGVTVVDRIPVAPTSSGRTVALADTTAGPLHIKLHYPRVLGRFTRQIDSTRALAGLDVTRMLADTRASLPENLAFLPETAALLTPADTAAVLRHTTPQPSGTTAALIPLFSLFSTDRHHTTDPTLLQQLLAEFPDPTEALWERLLCPILDGWTHLALHLGLLCEWNAQNLLVEVDPGGRPARVVFRDLNGTHRDLARRPSWVTTLADTDYRVLAGRDEEDRAQRSWLFDFKLGDYVLDALIAAAPGSPYDREALTTCLRRRFDAHVAAAGLDITDLFPIDGAAYAQPPGPLVGRRWIERRSTPPIYRSTANGGLA